MADKNIKEVEGGEVITLGDNDGVEIDTSTQSVWIKIVNLAAEIVKRFNNLTEDTSPDRAADYLASYDTSATTAKKVLLKNAGKIVQAVHSQTGALATGTTTIPFDDTIPQNTEGDQYMTLAITPTSTTNKLVIEVVVWCAYSVAAHIIAALFQDTTAGSLAAASRYQATANGPVIISFRYEMTAGTISATTFKVRAGGQTAGTLTFNGASGGRIFGGVAASSIRITEVQV